MVMIPSDPTSKFEFKTTPKLVSLFIDSIPFKYEVEEQTEAVFVNRTVVESRPTGEKIYRVSVQLGNDWVPFVFYEGPQSGGRVQVTTITRDGKPYGLCLVQEKMNQLWFGPTRVADSAYLCSFCGNMQVGPNLTTEQSGNSVSICRSCVELASSKFGRAPS